MKGWLKRGVDAFLLPFAAMASQQAAADDWTLELAPFTATTGYRFTLGQRHSLDLMAGLRYVGLDAEIDDRQRSSNSSRDIYDAVVMVRPIVQLAENWQLMPPFSIGTGDTDLTWEVFPEIIYQPGEWKFRFGYRNLNFDYEDGDDELDLSMRGLLLGVGFVF